MGKFMGRLAKLKSKLAVLSPKLISEWASLLLQLIDHIIIMLSYNMDEFVKFRNGNSPMPHFIPRSFFIDASTLAIMQATESTSR